MAHRSFCRIAIKLTANKTPADSMETITEARAKKCNVAPITIAKTLAYSRAVISCLRGRIISPNDELLFGTHNGQHRFFVGEKLPYLRQWSSPPL